MFLQAPPRGGGRACGKRSERRLERTPPGGVCAEFTCYRYRLSYFPLRALLFPVSFQPRPTVVRVPSGSSGYKAWAGKLEQSGKWSYFLPAQPSSDAFSCGKNPGSSRTKGFPGPFTSSPGTGFLSATGLSDLCYEDIGLAYGLAWLRLHSGHPMTGSCSSCQTQTYPMAPLQGTS